MKKHSFESVKKYIEENSNCVLLSKEYVNTKQKLLLKCSCGEIFQTNLNSFKGSTKNKPKRKCDYCSGIKKRIKQCVYCGNEFIPHHKKQTFCSKQCFGKSIKTGYIVRCSYCNKEIYRPKHRYNSFKQHYCNQNCKNEHLKTLLLYNNNPNFKNKTYETKCSLCNKLFYYKDYYNRKYKYCSQECKAIHQKTLLLGENNPNFKAINCTCSHCNKELKRTITYLNNHLNIFCSKQCYYDWMSVNNTGINNHNFDPNITQEDRENKRIIEGYINWRRHVFNRDSFSCICCGDSRGGNLMAHHLDGYNWCIEKRTDLNNGVTLCKKCHVNFHNKYGYGNNTRKQFEEFMLDYYKDI